MRSKHVADGRRAVLRGVGRLGLIALAAGLAACAEENEPTAQKAPPPAQVSVVQVSPRTVALERIYPARAQAAEDVEVRARVQGILLERNYDEGAQVEAGTVLFRIDPATFEARVQRAEAELARAQAQLRQAKREWTRTSALFSDNAVSARQRDESLSALELAQATVKTSEAVLRDARIELAYTQVRAPIAGVTGLRAVSQGNLVQPGALLTTVRRLDPIHVLFSLPEGDAVAQRLRGDSALPVSLRLADGSTYAQPGAIDYTASFVDPRTGTVQARAVVPNPDGTLLPGQFVRVSVGGLEVSDVIVVPAKAVAQSPHGPAVYVVDEHSVAQTRPVTLGQRVQEGQIVTEGLAGGERVIIEGLIGVQAGAPVAIIEPKTGGAVTAAATTAMAGGGR